MPFQDPPPAVLKPIFVEIHREIGSFRMPLWRLRRQIARNTFLNDLCRRLRRSHLTVAVDGGWILVTDTAVGGYYRDVPLSILVRYRGILQLFKLRSTNRLVS
jgi:hypothetical protein